MVECLDPTRREKLHSRLLESWLELADDLSSRIDLKNVLFDRVTGLPTTPLLFPQIEEALARQKEVAILCINVIKYSKIEEIYGWQVFDDIMFKITEALKEIVGKGLRETDTIAELMVSGNAFVILLAPPRELKVIALADIDKIAERVEKHVHEHLKETIPASVYQKFGCYIGSAIVTRQENVRVERLVFKALEQALVASGQRERRDAEMRQMRLRQIIENEQIHTLFHPVVSLGAQEIVGYEALSRGPADGEFERPDKLFRVAYDGNLVTTLERLCRRKALTNAHRMGKDRLLFINVEPESVTDPELRQITSSLIFNDLCLSPASVVLEITERTAILDFAVFRSALEYLRALGFSIAVDDAGAGYGSLQCIAEIKPDFIKLDMSLIRGIDEDHIKQSLVSTLAQFGTQTGVKVIAEGIETVKEYRKLRELGIDYGQGYLFAYPSEPFADIRRVPEE